MRGRADRILPADFPVADGSLVDHPVPVRGDRGHVGHHARLDGIQQNLVNRSAHRLAPFGLGWHPLARSRKGAGRPPFSLALGQPGHKGGSLRFWRDGAAVITLGTGVTHLSYQVKR